MGTQLQVHDDVSVTFARPLVFFVLIGAFSGLTRFLLVLKRKLIRLLLGAQSFIIDRLLFIFVGFRFLGCPG